jgi:hypothetical protein
MSKERDIIEWSEELDSKGLKPYFKANLGNQKETVYTAALSALDREIKENNFEEAYGIFEGIKEKLSEEKQDKFKRYEEALAKRGERLRKRYEKQNKEAPSFENNILEYSEEHSQGISGLEKAVNLLSLGAIVVSLFLGYGGITGNIIVENTGKFYGIGAIIFVLGILGILISNKRKWF